MKKYIPTIFWACCIAMYNVPQASAQIDASSTVQADELSMEKKRKRSVTNPDLTYQPRSWYFYVSTGAPNNLRGQWSSFEDYGTFTSSQRVPYTIKLERTLSDGWGVVVGASRVAGEYGWVRSVPDSAGKPLLYNQGFKYGNTSFFAGATRYISYNDKYAISGSATLGYNLAEYQLINEGQGRVAMQQEPKAIKPLYYNIVLCGRYHFTRRWGMYAEVGYGRLQFINIGTLVRLSRVSVLDKRGRVTKY